MWYVKTTLEEEKEYCSRRTNVLIFVQYLEKENEDSDIMFAPKYREEDYNIFQDIKTVTALNDDFMREFF